MAAGANLGNIVTGLPVLGIITSSRYGDFMTAVIIMAGALGVAFLIHLSMNFYLSVIARKTRTTLDDAVVSALKKPVYLLALATGIYIALLQIKSLSGHVPLMTRLYQSACILVLAYAASKAVTSVLKWLVMRRSAEEAKVAGAFLPLTAKLVSILIYVIAIIGVLDQLNVKITALVASLGVASLAVALALQDTLANFFAGIYVMADRPVRVGDFVRLENGEEGYVIEIGWRSTKVRTLPNNVIVIPNSKLAQSVVTNYYLPEQETSFVVKCGVAYGSDLDKVERVTIKAAKDVQQSVEGATRDFEPFIRFNEFGDSNINFSIILRVDEPAGKYLAIHELIKRLTKAYSREGIEISWPVRTVHMKNVK